MLCAKMYDTLYHTLCGESNEAGTNTEAGTLARHNTHGGAEDVQHGEHSGSGDGYSHNLVHGQGLLGDKDQSQGNSNTFNNILDDTG